MRGDGREPAEASARTAGERRARALQQLAPGRDRVDSALRVGPVVERDRHRRNRRIAAGVGDRAARGRSRVVDERDRQRRRVSGDIVPRHRVAARRRRRRRPGERARCVARAGRRALAGVRPAGGRDVGVVDARRTGGDVGQRVVQDEASGGVALEVHRRAEEIRAAPARHRQPVHRRRVVDGDRDGGGVRGVAGVVGRARDDLVRAVGGLRAPRDGVRRDRRRADRDGRRVEGAGTRAGARLERDAGDAASRRSASRPAPTPSGRCGSPLRRSARPARTRSAASGRS